MIKFVPENLHRKILYVNKITNNGKVYYIEDGIPKSFNGLKSFYTLINKKFHITEFKTSKKMEFLFYKDTPLSINFPVFIMFDNQKKSELENEWQGNFEKYIEDLNTIYNENKEKRDIYIDGKYLYMLKKKKETEKESSDIQEDEDSKKDYKIISSSEDGSINLLSCLAYNLLTYSTKKSYRKVIVYKTKDSNGNIVECVSSTIPNIKYKDVKTKQVNFDKMNDYFEVNLFFLLDAAKTMGGFYGYEATEFLNIEEILIELDTVNLFTLPTHTLELTTIDKNLFQCIAWVLGFYYRNTDLNKAIKFRSIFHKLFDVYLTPKKKIKNLDKKINQYYEHHELKNIDKIKKEFEVYREVANKQMVQKTFTEIV